MKAIFLLFACLGFLVGGALIFASDANPMEICEKSCGITRALIEIFGNKVARVINGLLWIAGGACFAWLAFKKSKQPYNPNSRKNK